MHSNTLLFYDVQGHHASFSLPPVALRELAKPRPTLRETSADLEEIMAYGEEDEGGRSDTNLLSHRWEPDVGIGCLLCTTSISHGFC